MSAAQWLILMFLRMSGDVISEAAKVCVLSKDIQSLFMSCLDSQHCWLLSHEDRDSSETSANH